MRNVDPTTMTRIERREWAYAIDAMKMVEYDLLGHLRAYRALPDEWHEIWKDEDRRDPKRSKITVRFDADVVKFFRAMGPGYQHRMNRVLRAFMHFRLAKLVEGPDTTDFVLKPETVLQEDISRPKWGETAAWVDEVTGKETGRGGNAQEKPSTGTRVSWSEDKYAGPKGRF